MTSVSQLVPTYATGGISDQPDELKRPGQVRDAVNVYPDLINGLTKRPGLAQIGIEPLQDPCFNRAINKPNGSWFSFYRENPASKSQEIYVARVTEKGRVQVWDAATGQAKKVYLSETPINPETIEDLSVDDLVLCPEKGLPGYLDHDIQDFLQFLTINNYTFITNPGKAVTMSETTADKRPYEAFVEITQLVYGREYRFDIDMIDTDGTTLIRSAERIELINAGDFAGYDDPSCPAQFNQTVTLDTDNLRKGDDEGQRDLVVRITSTGVQVPDGDSYECEYRHEVTLVNGGRNIARNNVFRYFQNGGDVADGDNDPFYDIKVTKATREFASSDFPITGVITASDGDTTESIRSILEELKDAIVDQSSGTFVNEDISVVGNGLYITNDEPFSVSTSEKDLFNILSNEDAELDNPYVVVNNVARLPIECRHGMIVKVANSFSDDDDYWVEFKSNYESDTATGYWDECPEPGGYLELNPGTMPHILAYARDDEETIFILGPCEWKSRECGNNDFNPSFVDFTINNMIYYRNRLVALSQENVIMSRAGELFNFFPVSALAVAPKDPIDITATTNYSSVLEDALVINNGLVIFSNFQQFLFTTDSDVLDPTTAKISEISRYDYNSMSRPINLGTNIGFLGKSDGPSRFYEMSNIFREGPVDVLERSKIVSESISPDLALIADAKETGLILMGKYGSTTVWGYRYFKESSQRELQAAWFKWELPKPLVFHTILDDTYYCVMEAGVDDILLTSLVIDSIEGPWLDLGSPFKMSIDLPTTYVVKQEQAGFRADTTSSLSLHRMHFNTGRTNYYNVDLIRKGKDNYSMEFEQSIQDAYLAEADPETKDREETVPIYDRNTSVDVSINSEFNGPFTLYSLRWEGDYNPRYYKRV